VWLRQYIQVDVGRSNRHHEADQRCSWLPDDRRLLVVPDAPQCDEVSSLSKRRIRRTASTVRGAVRRRRRLSRTDVDASSSKSMRRRMSLSAYHRRPRPPMTPVHCRRRRRATSDGPYPCPPWRPPSRPCVLCLARITRCRCTRRTLRRAQLHVNWVSIHPEHRRYWHITCKNYTRTLLRYFYVSLWARWLLQRQSDFTWQILAPSSSNELTFRQLLRSVAEIAAVGLIRRDWASNANWTRCSGPRY